MPKLDTTRFDYVFSYWIIYLYDYVFTIGFYKIKKNS